MFTLRDVHVRFMFWKYNTLTWCLKTINILQTYNTLIRNEMIWNIHVNRWLAQDRTSSFLSSLRYTLTLVGNPSLSKSLKCWTDWYFW